MNFSFRFFGWWIRVAAIRYDDALKVPNPIYIGEGASEIRISNCTFRETKDGLE
jgi:hypothetical protein